MSTNICHTFLVELGTEELPPTQLLGLSQALEQGVCERLQTLGLRFGKVQPFATPRRLALLIESLPSKTPVSENKVWGPPAKVAFDAEGKPTKAAQAFAAKNGLSVEDLSTENDGKVDKLVAMTSSGGELTTELLPQIVRESLAALPINKRMRWGSSREEFVRPVQWLMMLWDGEVIPCQILGLQAGRVTRSHRFHCQCEITIQDPESYATLLREEGFVVANFDDRKETIRQQVIEQGKALGGAAVIDEDLLEEVTALVEWPVSLAGQFDREFLEVPAEALISSMKEHQKYFHVVDGEGQLLPHFITVSNIRSADPAKVIAGNEKVIRPRLADAAFFFSTDKKTSLAQQREKLRSVVFQAKLGSIFDKTERIAALAKQIAQSLKADQALAERAGQLSKADLVTAMVYEFADMQGIAGYYYALNDGENQEVAQALNEQYLPRFAKDQLPATTTGTIVALADRLDTLAGIFGLGQIPTGSKDPFGLRRASLAVLRLLVDKKLDLDLGELLSLAVAQYPDLPKGAESRDLALTYMLERFRAWYEEAGIATEVYLSVAAKNLTCPLDIDKRVYAVAAFAELPEAQSLAAANKRVSNILAKQDQLPQAEVDSALLQESAEQALAEQVAQLQAQVQPLFDNGQYREALASLASLRASVDQFFDDVMVMAEDQALRNNRLALLMQLRNLFLEVADISCLAMTK